MAPLNLGLSEVWPDLPGRDDEAAGRELLSPDSPYGASPSSVKQVSCSERAESCGVIGV